MSEDQQDHKTELISEDDELLCRITIPGRGELCLNLNAKNDRQVSRALDVFEQRNNAADWRVSFLKVSGIFMCVSPIAFFVDPLRMPTAYTLFSLVVIEVGLSLWIRHLETKAFNMLVNISVKTEQGGNNVS